MRRRARGRPALGPLSWAVKEKRAGFAADLFENGPKRPSAILGIARPFMLSYSRNAFRIFHHRTEELWRRWQKPKTSADVRAFDPTENSRAGLEKAHLAVKGARELPPGTLHGKSSTPRAVLDLVGVLFYDFSPPRCKTKRSVPERTDGKGSSLVRTSGISDESTHPGCTPLRAVRLGEGMAA